MPPWWVWVLLASNAVVLFAVLAFNLWTRDVLVALASVEKKINELLGRS